MKIFWIHTTLIRAKLWNQEQKRKNNLFQTWIALVPISARNAPWIIDIIIKTNVLVPSIKSFHGIFSRQSISVASNVICISNLMKRYMKGSMLRLDFRH